jgi:hypothetical protein
MERMRSRRVLALLAVVFAAACSSEPDNGGSTLANMSAGCVPGIAVQCACPDGVTQGVQLCDANGLMVGACDCGAAGTSGAGAVGGTSGAGAAGDASGASGTGGASGTSGVGGTSGAGGAAGMTPTGGASGATAGSSGEGGAAGAMAPATNLAGAIKISDVSIYQAVKVALSNGGAPVIERNAPVIIGKEALLRVSVETLAGFSARQIVVDLTLSSSESAVMSQTAMKMISSASRVDDLDSTINFEIPGDQITADLKYAVSLREMSETAMGTVDPAARFPMTDGELIELGARDAGPLRVMLVPYRYQGDGSGRLPAMDDAQLELFERYLRSFYPASQIEVTVHDPVDYNAQVGPNTGWEQWLDFHCSLRTEEDPDPKMLYYGVMSPRDSQQAYGGGIYGISPVPNPAANYGRCSVGVGFQGNSAASTMAHELGHSLGLPHAPCGVDGGPFPYTEASIGVWGYSLGAKQLRDPGEYKDMMSYCDPAFISDYNFEKLFERVRYLNLQFDEVLAAPVRYTRVLIDKSGRASVRGSNVLKRAPAGDEDLHAVTMHDEKGGTIQGGKAYWLPFSEEGTGLWLVPEHAGVRSVTLGNTTVVLP